MSRLWKKTVTSKARRNVAAVAVALSLIVMQTPVTWAVAGAGSDPTTVTPQASTEVDQGAVSEIGVSFDHAYIVYADQVLAAPATKMTVPEGADIAFRVEPDKGYEVSSVILKSGSDEKKLEAESGGSYKVSASDLKKDSIIEVAATELPDQAVPNNTNVAVPSTDVSDPAKTDESAKAEGGSAPVGDTAAPATPSAEPELTAQVAATSDDLSKFLQDASISAPKNEAGEYVILAGTDYSISLSFAENSSLQFPNDGSTMSYRLPEGLHVADGDSGQLTIKVKDGVDVIAIPGNTYRIDDGVLYFNFNTDHADFAKLAAAANARFNITFTGSFIAGANGITFRDGISRDFEVDTSNSVTVGKDASFDKANGVVNYTVTVCSQGVSKNVVVKDEIAGDVLTLDADSIRATSSTGEAVVMNGGVSGNSFEYTIPQMVNDETVEITYSAKVDPSKIVVVDGQYVAAADNVVKVKSDGDPDPDEARATVTMDYTPTIAKSNATIVAEDGNAKTMRWTLTANGDAVVSMAGDTITDEIADASKSFTKYSGTGITVEVFAADGSRVRSEAITWDELESKSDSSWTYRVPASDQGKAYKYVITYDTVSDLTGKISVATVKNGVSTGGGQTASGSGQGVPVGGEVKVRKSVEKIDLENREITWVVTFNVPKSGLDSAVVTDTYPSKWCNGATRVEAVKNGSVEISGLNEGEAYNIDYGKKAATITFFKDAGKSSQGLQAGSERTVTIRLKTEINESLIEAARTNKSFLPHVNNVSLKANGEEKKAQAKATVIEPSVTKTVKKAGTRKVNGVELPVYKYEIVLANVTSDVNVIDDVYDTSLLEPIAYGSSDSYRVYGGDTSSQKVKGGTFSYEQTATGMRFTTSAASMPHTKDTPTGFYDKYKLVYYLTVRDEAALKTIIGNAAASADGKYAIGNSATWNELTGEASIDYEYTGLTKELLTSDDDLKKTDEDIWAEFRITLNPGAQTLNGGEPLTMTDTFENLSIDLESIQATPAEGVSWDVSGNVATYIIPDRTKVVITYKARVVVKDNGEPGDTVRVNFSNVAEMSGYKDGVNKTAERHNSGSGVASIPAIKVMKHAAGDMTHKLSGATFALLDENKNPVVGKDGPVTFTTDEDGMVVVRGDQEQLGWALEENTRYYLHETEAPEDYMLADSDFAFEISDDDTTDYDNFIYHTGDVLAVKNYHVLAKAGFEFTKYCFGATGDFKFKLTAADKDGKARTGDVKEYGADAEVVDNKTDAFAITVSNGEFADGSAKVVFPEISFAEDGDYYYVVEELGQSTPDMVVDEASYLVHVVVKDYEVTSVTYELLYDGENYGPTDDRSFYNNAAVKLGFSSISAQSYTDYAQKTSAYPKVKKYLNGTTDQLAGGEFEFELVDAKSGAVVARATNDESGNVAFFDEKNEDGLVFTKAGSYRYIIREVAGSDASVVYDSNKILLTVTVADTAEGLKAELSYSGAAEEPAFYNSREGMDLTVQKVSRYGGEGLVDCTYALWMVSDNGDVMIQEATSDANGFITFEDVSLIKGARYYFKEVEAPAGHTVDPYRTAYFSLNEDGTGLVLVEETADDGWHSKYDNIELDKARKASEGSE